MKKSKRSVERLVVTESDQVLCSQCFFQQFNESDEGTFYYCLIFEGTCAACGIQQSLIP